MGGLAGWAAVLAGFLDLEVVAAAASARLRFLEPGGELILIFMLKCAGLYE